MFATSSLGVTARAADDSARSMGVFLMVLWGVAMLVFTGDMAAGDASCGSSCSWSGLDGIHAAMQSILLLAALGTGATGAALWFGSQSTAGTA